MIPGLAEYVEIGDRTQLLLELYNQVKITQSNTFGKTPFRSYSLEDRAGIPTGYEQTFDPILAEHRKVHPNYQFRSTGFNTADSTEKDVFAHTDIDLDTEHPNYYNLVIPVFGASRIDYFTTQEDEVYLPELNAHGFATITNSKHNKKWGKEHPNLKNI